MNTVLRLVGMVLVAGGGQLATAEKQSQRPVYRKPALKTGTRGGVENPTKEQLLAMHKSQYILHARDGVLARVPVEKTWLPGDPGDMSHQELMGRLVLADDGTVYVMGRSTVCKSIDGGKNWISYPHDGNRARFAGKWGAYPDQVPLFIQVLRDGTLVEVGIPHAPRGEQYGTRPAMVWASETAAIIGTRLRRSNAPCDLPELTTCGGTLHMQCTAYPMTHFFGQGSCAIQWTRILHI